MSTAPIRTHTAKRGDAESAKEARQGVELAQSEVQRAENKLADVVRWNADRLAGAQSWLAETQRRLRCAMMIQRRVEPEVVAAPTDPAPWLPDATPTLLNWRERITPDAARVSDD